ncbi:L-rhamnose/proton symporter RhaT [Sphingobacterium sp. E70]|uniref:L-rhamnose/proton symporter RhaT n=1 Tax=Sphingobacterium sp. E70 TaxID=2853439 RepID=UPI0027952C70|nr:L-rhamnose/proton symporter RhaT [Sphingobacterium sp. E70]
MRNLLLCALAGTTWYLQFFFYGMGKAALEMAQARGFYIWPLLFSFQMPGVFY